MKIAVIDSETDPFEYGLVVKPFVWGFYTDDAYETFWGDDCTDKLFNYLDAYEEPLLIYAHNGGKFDFFFFIERFEGKLRIVNGRILQAYIGHHEFRDSYAAIPIPLSAYNKDVFDYKKMHRTVREKHKPEILKYLHSDCKYLYELVTGFQKEFGDRLTIGGAAMNEFKKFHSFETGKESYDTRFRPYYFGGRNQCFKGGIQRGKYKVYDVNSMYPNVMKHRKHPVGISCDMQRKITKDTAFLMVKGVNKGALPMREKNSVGTDLGLNFTTGYGEYYTTIHEFNAAIQTGTFDVDKILCTWDFELQSTFGGFVDHFYNARMLCQAEGDKMRVLFYKLILNSAYGKFAQDPTNFFEWEITCNEVLEAPWVLDCTHDNYMLWKKPAASQSYLNVATAASITGGARSDLLIGISKSENPAYCDTDSVICEAMDVDSDSKRLGAWKLEAEGVLLAVAGKKLYALFDTSNKGVYDKAKSDYKKGLIDERELNNHIIYEGAYFECVKHASKGARLKPAEILRVAAGDVVHYENPVPAFKLDGNHQFVARNIRATV